RPVQPFDMVYGVPAVVGAKKGFPNFNRFSAQRDIQVRRDLYFTRTGSGIVANQAYSLTISNMIGADAWNSYNTNYPRRLQLVGLANLGFGLTRDAKQSIYVTA